MSRRRMFAMGMAGLTGLVGCGDGSNGSDTARRTVTIFAASSLTDVFTDLGAAFTAQQDDVALIFNFGSSSDLVAQIAEGAPADVYASADERSMRVLVDSGAALGEPVVFATNRMEIVVEPGNPAGITGLGDLVDDDLVVVLCAPEVPCGRYAAEVFGAAGVEVTPKSLEENVRAVVAKVVLGEADAGLAYRTDVLAVGDAAQGIAIDDAVNVRASYPIAVVRESPHRADAQRFVDFVVSAEGSRILADAGFLAP